MSQGRRLDVVVATVVHDPADARILHREIRALVEAGHQVTYVAPWTATGVEPPQHVVAVDVPRAVGRTRLAALRAARRELAKRQDADLILVHDPELVLALPRRGRAVHVWDVHEDTGAALVAKPWLPDWLRPAAGRGVRWTERRGEKRCRLLLAEDSYRERFQDRHPVVPNTAVVPPTVLPPGADRVVYLGSVTRERGASEMVDLGRALLTEGIVVEVIGAGRDAATRRLLERAHADGDIQWTGPIPNDKALQRVQGALAGLSLLHDLPNYRHSLPTKVVEYMAAGIPVIATPLPMSASVVESARCGFLVPFGDVGAAVDAILKLRDDVRLREDLAAHGRETAQREYDWTHAGPRFVAQLEAWVSVGR